MVIHVCNEISRDGFTYAFGNLYARGHIQRIDGDRLKEMFLPTMSDEAKAAVRSEFHFARAQLQHCGVEFSQSGFAGNGVAILKDALRAGKCVRVPDSILMLKSQMHTEWLRTCPDKDLAKAPLYYQWILEKYFTDSWGRAEPARTKGVVGPLPYHSVEASEAISLLGRQIGLTKAVGAGTPDVLFLGWDSTAVRRAAFNYVGGEYDESENSESQEDSLSDDVPRIPSPAGKYEMDCDTIKRDFSLGTPFAKDHMTMTIRATGTPGLYQARFNFDAIEGVMMLSADEALLSAFVSDSRIDSGEDSDPLGNTTGSRERVLERLARKRILKRKRRMTDATLHGPAAKKAKSDGMGRPSKYFFRVRCRDLGNYKVCNMGTGMVKFNGPGLTGFTGRGALGGIGDAVVFSGRKVVGGGGLGKREKVGDDEMDDKDEEETDSGAETDYAWDALAG